MSSEMSFLYPFYPLYLKFVSLLLLVYTWTLFSLLTFVKNSLSSHIFVGMRGRGQREQWKQPIYLIFRENCKLELLKTIITTIMAYSYIMLSTFQKFSIYFIKQNQIDKHYNYLYFNDEKTEAQGC